MVDADFVGLVDRARAGDEGAVRALPGAFGDEVRLIVRVRCESPRHYRGYLAGVARNKVLEEYRRRTQTRKYDMAREERLYVRKGDRDEPRDLAASDPTPSQEAQAGDVLDRLVAGRTPREAEAIRLRRHGLTFEEIAERTGLNERSVRRVIESLRQRLEDRRP